ncbi:hybrid sensor histidine kinase/response regulator [Caenimonas sedimenti]|nr:ATP-binding protein [Caenimonas sedimenti]
MAAGPLRSLIDALSDEARRAEAAGELARALGAAYLLVYVEDKELRLLLPAPGMPKTLSAGPRWRAFLADCREPGDHAAAVDIEGQEFVAHARVTEHCALVLVGDKKIAFPEDFEVALPLLCAVLRAQQAMAIERAEASDARAAAAKAHQLAKALDAARGAAAELNHQLRSEHQRKDEFLAMLAHELRNPLAPMTSAIEIIRRAPERDAVLLDRQLAVMTRQLHQLTHLVDDLLDVSRVSRGLIELRLEVLRLDDLLAASLDASRPLVESRGHRVRVVEAPAPLHVHGDRVRLTQVFSNLLNNAAKYTPPGGEIELAVLQDGAQACIRISDTGVGIPKEMLGSIFEMFTQVPGSLDRAPGGLGIGLTLVRMLVDSHGGSVRAESAGPNQGSTFHVLLPLIPAPVDDAPKDAAGKSGQLHARVMVVDDNVDAAQSLAEILRLMGADVSVAHDGAHALELAQALGQPDIVLLDIGLPGMDGYATAREWRRRFGESTNLHALTGYGTPEDKRRTAQAGFNGHLVKPVSFEQLQELLASAGVAVQQ